METRNDNKNIEVRATYAQEYLNLLSSFDEANIVFIDEVGFNVSMRTLYGRSLIGTKAIHKVRSIRSRNVSVCCAITKNDVHKYAAQTSAFNIPSFQNFIQELVNEYALSNNTNVAFIMDNVRFHKNALIRSCIENKGFKLLYLPPYSPFLNPIENAFLKWKQSIIQSKPENENDLISLLSRVNDLITPEDCAGFYRNMMRYISQSILKIPISD